LGFGNGDDVTVLRRYLDGSSGPQVTNYYFRQWFSVNAASYPLLAFNLQRDDGAVVYLNGVEVYRENMPAGALTASSLATTNVSGHAPRWYTKVLAANSLAAPLHVGMNLLAVEIHQAPGGWDDVLFNFSLQGLQTNQNPGGNLAPFATLTGPTNGARFAAGLSVPLAAEAGDNDGRIAKVEFYCDAAKVGEDLTFPYTASWLPAGQGARQLMAVATDNGGARATSAVVSVTVLANSPPDVSIINPTNGTSLTVPANLLLEATASDPDGVTHVDFYRGNILMQQVFSPPYRYVWTNAYGSSVQFKAVAYDTLGAPGTSAPVTLSLMGNYPTMVAITNFASGDVLLPNEYVYIYGVASDVDNAVRTIDVYDKGSRLGQASSSSGTWSYYVSSLAAGSHQLTAVATDDQGRMATSAVVNLTVSSSPPPPNDNFANATPLEGMAVVVRGCNSTATIESGEPVHYGSSCYNSVWYTWTAPVSGPVSLGISSNFYYFEMAVYTNATLASLARVTNTYFNLSSYNTITFNATAGTLYSIAIATYYTGSGSYSHGGFTLSLRCLNTNPAAAIARPRNNAIVGVPGLVPVTVATMGLPPATNVDFYADGSLLGSCASPPFSILWTNPALGPHTLTAVAWNSSGAVTSAPVSVTAAPNSAPSVSVTNPVENASFLIGTGFALGAAASDADGVVTNVDFYGNGAWLGASAAAPFTFAWTNAPVGTNGLTAVATDNGGLSATSALVHVIVTNIPFAVTVTSPAQNQTFAYGQAVPFSASATSPDTVPLVRFFTDQGLLFTAAAPPYASNALGLAAGDYRVYATADDGLGGLVYSATNRFTIAVNPQEIQYWGGTYTETFDSMGPTGTTPPVGWHVGPAAGAQGVINLATLAVGDGSTSLVTNWNLGSSGSSDRALGSQAGSAAGGDLNMEVRLRNNVLSNITSFTVTYDGEQWLANGVSEAPQYLVMYFSTNGSNFVPLPPAFTFTSRVDSGTSALNGNLAANRTPNLGGLYTPPTPIPPEAVFYLRWYDTNNSGSDHQMGIDNVSIAAASYSAVELAILTSPAEGALFFEPATIVMQASAFASAGISRVDFYGDGEKLGEANGSPYSHVWSGVSAGPHQLQAVGIDTQGGSITSAVVNVSVVEYVAPSVTITNPLDGAAWAEPASFAIQVATEGYIKVVTFYSNGVAVGQDATAPHSFSLSTLRAGSYALRAVATDLAENYATSAPVNVTVFVAPGSRWVAFNDTYAGPGTHPNASTWNPFGTAQGGAPTSGPLKNILNGTNLPVTLTITTNSLAAMGSTAGVPVTGTPADLTFSPYIDWINAYGGGGYQQNTIQLLDDGSLTGAVTNTFTGLDPAKRYSFRGTSVRAEPTYTNRWTLVEILGAASFTNTHTSHVLTSRELPGQLNGSQAVFCAGDNRAGDMVEWAEIDPGPDGSFAIVMTKFNGIIPGTNTEGARSYGLIAFRLEEIAPGQTATLVSPANGAGFMAPATIALQATAYATAGVSRVEFYANAAKLGEDATSPFIWTWNGAPAGSYQLRAVAVDLAGLTATSPVVNIIVTNNEPPQVSLTSPTNGADFAAPAMISISAFATNSDDAIAKVEFYSGNTRLGQALAPPYGFSWNNAPGGAHVLRAVATDAIGLVTTSAPVTITVSGLAAGTNQFIGFGDTWKHLDDGSNQSNAWTALDYEDSAWPSGPAVLGFGHGGEATLLTRSNLLDGTPIITTYFRRAFTVTAPSAFTFLVVRLRRDDGAIVYLNGTEILRNNLPAGAVGYDTRAWPADDEGAAVWSSTNLSPTLLVAGANILAVEVHQADTNQWDPVFDLQLEGVITNAPPNVAISSLPDNALITALFPTNVPLQAAATDRDGLVSRVEFFANGAKVAEATASPWSTLWSNVFLSGIYDLTAVATDNLGAKATSAVVHVTVLANLPPTVTLTNPPDNALFYGPTNLTLGAEASDDMGLVTNVVFYSGTNRLGQATQDPFVFVWLNAPLGYHQLRVVATDEGGLSSTSAVVHISILNPIVTLISPASGTRCLTPGAVPVMADASDVRGDITNVTIYANGLKTLEAIVRPFAWIWTDPAAASYVLVAVATADNGLMYTSAPVNITVAFNVPPSVTLTSPPNNAQFTYPANVPLAASASDSGGGTVVKVEFFAGTTKLGEKTNSPYGLTWASPPVGAYTLVAVATDDDGTKGTSAPVNITVTSATVTRGPYLCSRGSSNLVVRWRTDQATDSRVRYGPGPASLTNSAGDSISTLEHTVSLTGLAPETRYYYSVGTTDLPLQQGADMYFSTAPPPGQSRPTRIWFLSDYGNTSSYQIPVRDTYLNEAAENKPADVWLTGGDNEQVDGSDPNYQSHVFNVYPSIFRNQPVFPTMGNHDTYTSSSPGPYPYYDIFNMPVRGECGGLASGSEHYYSFDYGDIHFICLDSITASYSSSANTAMFNWLQQDLAQTTQRWIIAYWHAPPYTKGSHDSDSTSDVGQMTSMRTYALPILEAYGADLVLCGHSHVFERTYLLKGHYGFSTEFSETNKVDGGNGKEDGNGAYLKPGGAGTVYVTAALGYQPQCSYALNHPAHVVKFRDYAGSCFVDINSNRLDFKFLSYQGTVMDHFTMLKGSSQAPPAAPSAFAASPSGTSAILTWANNTTNEAGYSLERSVNGAPFIPIAGVGANLTSYSDTGLNWGNAYYYRLRAWNSAGASDYSAIASLVPSGSPTIDRQPQSVTNAVGDTSSLYVLARGTSPLNYQWYHGTNLMAGRTGNTLSLTNMHSSDAGNYQVRVWNGGGAITSQVAVVTVTGLAAPPTLVAPPRLASGNFTVTFSGTPGLTYTIQFKETLADPWQTLREATVPSNSLIVVEETTQGSPQRFYRLLPPNQ
jgi:acid phosphatase type 7